MYNKSIFTILETVKTEFLIFLERKYSKILKPKNIKKHIQLILITRIFGNAASLITLLLSIIILLRPKLRCPRNYVHINLFIAYLVRTFMTALSELATRSDPHSKRKLILTDSYHDDDQDMFFCRSVVSFFRYSSSAYHMAILSEAIYLVLLLKFPYYNELRGSKFCILITWLLPILWVLAK
ncbi:pituitary adenylate cyclase-activating polypeptide type I receptor-like [Brachionus plicatilis]|uniref:Pituitary adenylate cyclase-activating polypeptide type I receptor-like n=1 Tax=Brachionus plicatilis TaxID=10195 RepID=A0A3M7P3M9_BRAPC|nr:pituitary adenylate cyclase-activating polypeptide type I receptor-like [Brachionus plicatilis]